MTLRHEAARPPAAQPPGKTVWFVAASLAAYAVLAPVVVAALAGPLPLRVFGTIALATCLLGPGLATILACWRGLGPIARDIAARPDDEPQQTLLRLLVSAVALAYLAILDGQGVPVQTPVALYVVAVLSAWLILIHCVVVPHSAVRRVLALGSDTLFLSLFLHLGGAAAAPWVVLYLAATLDYGMRFGVAMLTGSAIVNAAGFAAVAMTTPVWRDMPLADLALFLALVFLPLHGAALAGRAAAARAGAAAAQAARSELAVMLRHELRVPLNTLLGMAAMLDRSRLEPAQQDMLAAAQVSGETLRDLVNTPAPGGSAVAEDDKFVLREALGSAVAMLKPQAEARGLALTLSIDPRLPAMCYGAPIILRRVLLGLLDTAIRRTKQGQIALAATLTERDAGRVRLRLSVRVEGTAGAAKPDAEIAALFAQADARERSGQAALGLALAEHIAPQLGGTIALDPEAGMATLDLSFGYDEDAAILPPDLAGRRIALVTPDQALADRLEHWIKAWDGESRWVAAAGDILADSDSVAGEIVVIDGCADLLARLSLTHQLATRVPTARLVLIAPKESSEAVAGLTATHLAAVIEQPVSAGALANALSSIVAVPNVEGMARTAGAGLKILVADDSAETRERVRGLLERAGHRSEIVAEGGAALSALDTGGFDAALLALDMPGVAGDAVAKLFRMRHPGGGTALVALAGALTSETEARCREAGFDAVLGRPLEGSALEAAIEGARARRTTMAQTPAAAAPDVTPISAHPRFLGEGAEIMREATIDSLRGLGGNEFVAEVVETFRNDASRLVPRLRGAAERGDLVEFATLAHALRSSSANIGGTRLCQILTALEEVTQPELSQAGAAYVDKIEAELGRLEAALEPFTRAQRRG